MLTKTAQQWYNEFQKAIAYKQAHRDSNSAKDICKYETMQNLLLSVDENTQLTVSGIPLNAKTGLEICNCGDLAEVVIRWVLAKRKPTQIAKRACGADDWNKWEIKTAMGCRWLPTKSPNRKTILVNARGVFKLTGAEVAANVDKNGRLPYNAEIGEPFCELEELLGIYE